MQHYDCASNVSVTEVLSSAAGMLIAGQRLRAQGWGLYLLLTLLVFTLSTSSY